MAFPPLWSVVGQPGAAAWFPREMASQNAGCDGLPNETPDADARNGEPPRDESSSNREQSAYRAVQ